MEASFISGFISKLKKLAFSILKLFTCWGTKICFGQIGHQMNFSVFCYKIIFSVCWFSFDKFTSSLCQRSKKIFVKLKSVVFCWITCSFANGWFEWNVLIGRFDPSWSRFFMSGKFECINSNVNSLVCQFFAVKICSMPPINNFYEETYFIQILFLLCLIISSVETTLNSKKTNVMYKLDFIDLRKLKILQLLMLKLSFRTFTG